MKLALSNIAWEPAQDQAVADLLARFGIDAIDIAPGKYFQEPAKATVADMDKVRLWWAERGITITGMQSLLFGTTGLNVFGSEDSQTALLSHLSHVCRIGGGLGSTLLVFGSPRNRDRSGMNDEQALKCAVSFFHRLGDIAQANDVIVCLEPNPTCYGANFMTNSAETAAVVRAVDHPAIKMQLDTGALTINGEDPMQVLEDHAALIGHIHASEPDLLPLGDGATDHVAMKKAIERYLPDYRVSIEMVATRQEPHLDSIERALKVAIKAYGEASA